MEATTPVVLVHGFWHGSWCWSLVGEQLASRGVASVAVDLDGHGLKSRSPRSRWGRPFDAEAFAVEPSPVAGITASSAAASLVEQVRRIGSGRPCLVVAHSMGGTVATAAAEQAPELFAELMYVTAFAPVSGAPTAQYLRMPENAGEMVASGLSADPASVGALRYDTGDSDRRAVIRETFYNDVTDEVTAEAAISLLTTDAPAGVPSEPITVTAERYGSIPHSYVVCTRDNAIRPTLQRLMIREIDAISAQPTTVVEMDSSHSPFLSRPTALADVIHVAHRAIHRHDRSRTAGARPGPGSHERTAS
ncbi:alpha/beta hydrolase [Streptomyces iranensis]|uniref:Alpha/beta hydrolase fold protein n=1 Tax=Streptomyces iranensis TaxID=576784 RepID=A0A061A0L5_9ACTN|nr:alpha/beta hydrolase [Streptomyces iranensis]MBP2060164.1 pimeloyl-ACP methyl ester carboxylesterase [Streptomyces iranensis]CDR13767.1 alpha/beta hydrolase fold protein [Streptomyces iranensis]